MGSLPWIRGKASLVISMISLKNGAPVEIIGVVKWWVAWFEYIKWTMLFLPVLRNGSRIGLLEWRELMGFGAIWSQENGKLHQKIQKMHHFWPYYQWTILIYQMEASLDECFVKNLIHRDPWSARTRPNVYLWAWWAPVVPHRYHYWWGVYLYWMETWIRIRQSQGPYQ